MKKIETLQDLRTFVEGIPANEFAKFTLEDSDDLKCPKCIMGHLNYYLTGSSQYDHKWDVEHPTSICLLESLDIPYENLIDANNRADIPKTGVLEFIDEKIKETA